jgi:hypothetical protein
MQRWNGAWEKLEGGVWGPLDRRGSRDGGLSDSIIPVDWTGEGRLRGSLCREHAGISPSPTKEPVEVAGRLLLRKDCPGHW